MLKIYTEPTEEPVLLDDLLKKHLRVDSTDDDALIESYIKAARLHCELFQNRRYITQTWDYYLDAFPTTGYIEMPYPPLQSVTSVQYKPSTSSTLTTWASTNYIVDTANHPGRICLAYGISWPSTYDEVQAVQIRFVCGYGLSSSVPQNIKLAIMRKVCELWEHRGDESVDANAERAIEYLLMPERLWPI